MPIHQTVSRRSSREWGRLVRECEVSGLSRARFAAREGLNARTFAWWASRLAPRRPRRQLLGLASPAGFVPVRVGRSVSDTTGAASKSESVGMVRTGSERVEVRLVNGRRIRCALSQVDDPRFAKLLVLVEGGRRTC